MKRYFSKSPVFLIGTCLAALLMGENAYSLTATRYASVEIVDKPTSLRPVQRNNYGNVRENRETSQSEGPRFFSKQINIPTKGETSKTTEAVIEAEYIISGYGKNNVQLDLAENDSKEKEIKFKSMNASSNTQSAKNQEASIKLATVVTVPHGINGGKRNLSLQLSALYE